MARCRILTDCLGTRLFVMKGEPRRTMWRGHELLHCIGPTGRVLLLFCYWARWADCFSNAFLWKILLLFIWIGLDPNFFPPISYCLPIYWLRPFIVIDPRLFHPIHLYLCFSYKYRYTAHNSSVLFWTQNRLDQIKVIARAHPCHYFHIPSCAKYKSRPTHDVLFCIVQR
jgi:hypothetical protein